MSERKTIECKCAMTICLVIIGAVLFERGDMVEVSRISLEIVSIWLA